MHLNVLKILSIFFYNVRNLEIEICMWKETYFHMKSYLFALNSDTTFLFLRP